MSWLPLSFGAPMMLWGLLALPVIWWLLKLTPPKPQAEVFPPLKILARVLKREETPQNSPWWLTLLRLLMAALVIAALAEPVFNPREPLPSEGSTLTLVIDNGWAAAPDWDKRVATAERLIADAGTKGEPVLVAFTAEKPNAEIGPFDASDALSRLRAARPRPIPTDRPAVYDRIAQVLASLPGASIAILADGLAAPGDNAAFKTLLSGQAANVVWVEPDQLAPIGLSNAENEVDGFALTAIRAAGDPAPRQVTVGAFDDKGRRIADTTLRFGPGETKGTGRIAVPFELRNDFSSIALDGERHAGAVRVLDDSSRRRRVGLLSQSDADQAQPLLSPLYYIRRALSPFADLVEPASADLADAIPQLLDRKPAMIVMADIGTIPAQVRQRLVDWVDNGGTLVRFAGSRLAAAGNDDDLLPVHLRTGERSLGGSLSWTTPQPVAEFPAGSPFADLPAPVEVTVSRQVLAEPGPDIADRTWASLADGTPLVTGLKKGKGTLVLFHTTPEATWSNLPISGSFVEMLRRLVQLSRNQGSATAGAEASAAALAPYRMIGADGMLVPPPADARPLPANAKAVTLENPPGLYGSEAGVVAHNLLAADAVLTPLTRPQMNVPVTTMRYAFDESLHLKGSMIAAALALMLLDTLAVFWMGGLFSRGGSRRRGAATATTAALLIAVASFSLNAGRARADQVSGHLGGRPADGMSWWGNVHGDMQRYDHASLYDGMAPAGLFGIDWARNGVVVGGFAGYGRMDADFGGGKGDFTQSDTTAGLFAGWYGDHVWVNGQASYSWLGYDVTRKVQLGPATRVHKGSPDGSNLTAALNAGYEFGQEGGFRHGPVAGVVWQKVKLDGYLESNASATALGYGDQDVDSTVGRIGWQARFDGGSIHPYVQVTYDHEF